MNTKERFLLTKRLGELAKTRRKTKNQSRRDEIGKRMYYMVKVLDTGRHFYN